MQILNCNTTNSTFLVPVLVFVWALMPCRESRRKPWPAAWGWASARWCPGSCASSRWWWASRCVWTGAWWRAARAALPRPSFQSCAAPRSWRTGPAPQYTGGHFYQRWEAKVARQGWLNGWCDMCANCLPVSKVHILASTSIPFRPRDNANAKFSTNWDETNYSTLITAKKFQLYFHSSDYF